MRAKSKLTIKLALCCLALLLLVTVLVACNNYKPAHYDYKVTFNYNVGNSGAKADDMYLGVFEGGLVSIRPGYSDNFSETSITGYYLEGWYKPKLDAAGNLQHDTESGKVLLEENAFDFEHERVYSDITLYANLVKSPRMLFVDAETDAVLKIIDGKRPGESRPRPANSLAPKKEVDGVPYTFMGEYYADKECQTVFNFERFRFGDDDVNVYCQFIEGSWTLVRTAREFLSAMSNGEDIYLLEDIDLSGQRYVSSTYNSEFNGNGHTVSGMTLSYTGLRGAITSRNKPDVGMFQTLLGRSYVHDVTFENVTINVEISSVTGLYGVRMGFFATRAENGARVENVKINGTMYLNNIAKTAVDGGLADVSDFILVNETSSDRIVGCDYSGVKLIYLS